jgi:hypothetical protein
MSSAPRLLLLLTALACAATPARADRLVLLDGSTRDAAVTGIDPAGRVAASDGEAVDLQGLRQIERTGPVTTTRPCAAWVLLAGRGVVRADAVTTDREYCTVDWALGKGLRIPMGLVRALVLRPGAAGGDAAALDAGFAAALAAEPEKQDRLYVRHGERYASVPGVMQTLGEAALAFDAGDGAAAVPRARVYGIIMARIGAGPQLDGQCLVQLADGSSIWGRVAGCDGKILRLQVGDNAVELPWDSVARLSVRSTRMVFVSDLDPVRTEVDPDLSIAGWWRDSAMWGRPLRAGGSVFAKGIGAHAVCRLTYDAGGKFDAFAAVIAVSPIKSTRGAAEFVVRGDGTELFRARLRAGDEPRSINVKITGVRELTLALERAAPDAGDAPDDRNFGAHGNWCDARLIRTGP